MTKKPIYITLAILFLIVLGIALSIPILNSAAEKRIYAEIERLATSYGISENLDVETITVDAVRGNLTVHEIRFKNDSNTFLISQAHVKVSPTELISLALDRNGAALTDITVVLEDTRVGIDHERTRFASDLGTSTIHITGSISADAIAHIVAQDVTEEVSTIQSVHLATDSGTAQVQDTEYAFSSLSLQFDQGGSHIQNESATVYTNVADLTVATTSDDMKVVASSIHAEVEGKAIIDLLVNLINTRTFLIQEPDIDTINLSLEGAQIIHSEAVLEAGSLVFNFDTQAEEASLTLKDVRGRDMEDSLELSFEKYGFHVSGSVISSLSAALLEPDQAAEDVHIDSLRMELEGSHLHTEDIGVNVEGFLVDLTGLHGLGALIEVGFSTIPPSLQFGAEMQVQGSTIELEEELINDIVYPIEDMLGPLPFLRDPDTWALDTLLIKTSLTNDRAAVEDFSLVTDWLDISGSVSIGIEMDEIASPFVMNMEVHRYPQEITPLLEIMSYLFETDIPSEDSFDLQVRYTDEMDIPEIIIRNRKTPHSRRTDAVSQEFVAQGNAIQT